MTKMILSILIIISDFQVAKSGRRARLAADQLSTDDPRYVRKPSAVEILDGVLKHSRVSQFDFRLCHEYSFLFFSHMNHRMMRR